MPAPLPNGLGEGCRGLATANKVGDLSPHGLDKALEWMLCIAFTHFPPRGDGRQHASHVARRKTQTPARQNRSVASSWAYAIKAKPCGLLRKP